MLASTQEPPQAIIFYFDGVIVQSVAIKVCAFAEVYREEDPAKVAAVLTYQRHHGGVSRREKFRHFERTLFGRPGDAESVEILSNRFTEIVHDAVISCPFVAGAEEFLNQIWGCVPLHLVSGTPQDELEHILHRRDLRHFFESVWGAPVCKRSAFERILTANRHDARRVVAIGDSITEFEAAGQVGIPFIGIVPTSEPSPFPGTVPCLPSLRGLDQVLGLDKPERCEMPASAHANH